MIQHALIIAGGAGSRLRRSQNDLPKPLRRVAGMSLLERIIHLSKKAGVTEFVIVVGHQKEKIISAIRPEKMGVKITFVENPEWEKSNGISVLAAKPYLKENFALLMADHLFDFETLEKLGAQPLSDVDCMLAVDSKVSQVFDLDDATKVLSKDNRIVDIGKEIQNYNVIDTGMFLCSPALFDALESVKKDGDCSLSHGIKALAQKGRMGTWDIGNAFWQDVDTPEMFKHAEKHLLNACRKPTDGIISRNLNRYVSLFFTKYLLKLNLSANQMTFITFLVGLAAGHFVSKGDYWNVVLGAFLFQMSSIMDGCDGEMAKLLYTSSKLGQWLDTLGDNSSYVIFIAGVILGLVRQGNPHIHITGWITAAGLFLTLFVMFFYLIRHTQSGSLLAVEAEFKNNQKKAPSFLSKIYGVVRYMVKRDFFAFAFFILALFGKLEWILILVMIGANVMWMVLLNTVLRSKQKPEISPA